MSDPIFATSTASNPYDMQGAEAGVDPAIEQRFNRALAEWEASRNKIVTELVPNLQAAIVSFRNGVSAIQAIVDAAHAAFPLFGVSTGPAENNIQELSNAVANMTSLGATVQNVLNQVPSLVRMVNSLALHKA